MTFALSSEGKREFDPATVGWLALPTLIADLRSDGRELSLRFRPLLFFQALVHLALFIAERVQLSPPGL